MTRAGQIGALMEPGLSVVDDARSLNGFLRPQSAAALWIRQIPPGIQDWLDGLAPGVLPNCRVILPKDAVTGVIKQLFDMSGLPDGPERAWLHADIVSLAEMFSDLMSASVLRLRLEVVTTNACRKFHVDAIGARLVCTYRGTGTQYGVSFDGSHPHQVSTVPTGAPILLRGTLWPSHPPSGLLHRSPPHRRHR